ncbi:MAG: site-specific integrase [Pseudomonadota bacterium]
MSRSYKSVRPKSHRVYSVDELMALFAVSRNTVTNWINNGLRSSNDARPYVFRGAVVKRFHEERRARYSIRLRAGEFKCLCCKAAVRPPPECIEETQLERGGIHLRSACPDCDATVMKVASEADLAFLRGTAIPNKRGSSVHEENAAVSSGIGSSKANETAHIWLGNDRTIAAWQFYAARDSIKTQDRHLSAIREFEAFVRGKPFQRLTQSDVSRFRDHLRRAMTPEDGAPRAKSTVAHTLSHVRDFLGWLIKQERFEKLPRDLPDYLQLARADYAEALPRARRDYPQIDEAEAMLVAMPKKTRLQRRSRAIFATAFLGALRADTLV